ncbi:MAG: Ig-like domain-containing protein [Cyanobacteria bacterium]|nr:Ig-like domain-containing protein [Cyanobacteriota bacterium]
MPIAFQSAVLSSFLPVTADVSPLLEFSIDFSGRDLSIGADLSVLASQLPGVTGDDALVIVRVDAMDGRSRLVPIAVGERSGDRYYARATHGLAGLTRGGRHVWYRVAGGVGFVRGSVEANGAGLAAIVEAAGLPFAVRGATQGQYTAVSRPGTVSVRARAEGTSLVGEQRVSVAVNIESPLNLTLAGAVSTAAITPANGAINISIASQIDVTAPVSITAGSVALATITFDRTGAQPGSVAHRVVLSGSGRSLAIVPQTRLAEGGTYAVTMSGLADAVGGAVIVPPITFTTADSSAPVYHPEQLTFSFPNEEGRVTLTGPPGTLAPGSSVLVINESTGEVATVAVNNDGSVGGPTAVGGDLVALLSDRLIVTITDLQGRTVSYSALPYWEHAIGEPSFGGRFEDAD